MGAPDGAASPGCVVVGAADRPCAALPGAGRRVEGADGSRQAVADEHHVLSPVVVEPVGDHVAGVQGDLAGDRAGGRASAVLDVLAVGEPVDIVVDTVLAVFDAAAVVGTLAVFAVDEAVCIVVVAVGAVLFAGRVLVAVGVGAVDQIVAVLVGEVGAVLGGARADVRVVVIAVVVAADVVAVAVEIGLLVEQLPVAVGVGAVADLLGAGVDVFVAVVAVALGVVLAAEPAVVGRLAAREAVAVAVDLVLAHRAVTVGVDTVTVLGGIGVHRRLGVVAVRRGGAVARGLVAGVDGLGEQAVPVAVGVGVEGGAVRGVLVDLAVAVVVLVVADLDARDVDVGVGVVAVVAAEGLGVVAVAVLVGDRILTDVVILDLFPLVTTTAQAQPASQQHVQSMRHTASIGDVFTRMRGTVPWDMSRRQGKAPRPVDARCGRRRRGAVDAQSAVMTSERLSA